MGFRKKFKGTAGDRKNELRSVYLRDRIINIKLLRYADDRN